MSNDPQLKQMSIDLDAARQQAVFPVDLMATFLAGGPVAQTKLKKYRDIIAQEPLFSKSQYPFLSRQEQMYQGILAAKRLIETAEENGFSREEFNELFDYIGIMTPLALNYRGFIPVIENQGSDEQIAKWTAATSRHAIIGCYCQTELSHGSNVAGLQTTATFDEKTDEFVINSPSLTAAKWWIGGLGLAATHAVVQAQLIIGGKNYGPHIFVVPIRSPETHEPIPGVTVGDIGPKAYGGFASTDNGFALFDHVRIPRENMLMKFAKVSRDGKYSPPVHSKLSYGSMVKLRVGIVSGSATRLAKAVTIAIRYCTVRRQFKADSKASQETQVISYSSVQHRLIPLLAIAIVLNISGQTIHKSYLELIEQLKREDARELPEIHIASCALKTWSSRRSTDGMEECRKAMGGHGFSAFSGVSELFAEYVPSNTYEGDNYVLVQQVARALIKQLELTASGKAPTLQTVSYFGLLKNGTTAPFQLTSPEVLSDPNVQLGIFGTRVARLVVDLQQQMKSGRPWSDLNMEAWNVSYAHAEYILLKQMIDTVQAIPHSEYAPLTSILKTVTDLFFLSIICQQSSMATFLCTQTIDPADLNAIQKKYRQALSVVADNAVGLTDGFGFTDVDLNTSLGKKNGRAYEALWEAAQKNPVNNGEMAQRFKNAIKEITHRKDNLEYIKAAKL